jgi:hypothetical protein
MYAWEEGLRVSGQGLIGEKATLAMQAGMDGQRQARMDTGRTKAGGINSKFKHPSSSYQYRISSYHIGYHICIWICLLHHTHIHIEHGNS